MKRTQNKASEFTLSREKIEALFNAATSIRDRTLLKLLYHCALRRGEAVALDVRDIDFNAKRIRVVSGKGDKERIVPIPPQVLSDLRFFVENRGRSARVAGPVFLSQKGKYKAIRVQRVNEIVAAAGVKAGVTNPNPRRRSVNPHLLRHSFARRFLDAGGSLRSLSYILGHSSISTTGDVYGTPSVAFVEEEYKRVMG